MSEAPGGVVVPVAPLAEVPHAQLREHHAPEHHEGWAPCVPGTEARPCPLGPRGGTIEVDVKEGGRGELNPEDGTNLLQIVILVQLVW